MQDSITRLREYVDGHEEEIFLRMKIWAQNELAPQVQVVNKPGYEIALFLLTHGFVQTFMEKVYDLRGRVGTTEFLRRFIDGKKKKEKFSLIAVDMHEMRNVMAHQLYSSRTHAIAFDYRLNTGWDRIGSNLHINPKFYGDRFIAAIDGGRLRRWRRFTTRVALTKQKYRFIRDWLHLPNGDPLRLSIENIITLPTLSAIRAAEKPLRKAFKIRYGI
jgi:hypothetical protein